jgi:hypothetical protein
VIGIVSCRINEKNKIMLCPWLLGRQYAEGVEIQLSQGFSPVCVFYYMNMYANLSHESLDVL